MMWVYCFIHLVSFVFQAQGNPTRRDVELERPERIVGGTSAGTGAFPYQVSIQRRTAGRYYHTCGGALIEPDIVVTAAHCVMYGGHLYVSAGMNNIQHSRKTRVRVASSRTSNYNNKNKENDIAILKLMKTMTISRNGDTPIDVISLPPEGFQARGMCSITGWGKTAYGGGLPDHLQVADVKIVKHKTCKRIFPKQYRIGNNMICAGGGKRDACQGDSGGPMACMGRNQQRYLSGITSWGIGCATPKVPGVYTEVAKYTSWIKKAIKSFREEEIDTNPNEEDNNTDNGNNDAEDQTDANNTEDSNEDTDDNEDQTQTDNDQVQAETDNGQDQAETDNDGDQAETDNGQGQTETDNDEDQAETDNSEDETETDNDDDQTENNNVGGQAKNGNSEDHAKKKKKISRRN